ncbi:IclR family transcriptional regulator [Jiangella muralis]|uniref:IclR family transcriptional regulator n=1 Tax=Jiangella muralis TaxID=702383 RepID=UPI00069DAAB4|nr:IclR family transcriptional regulator [Jiangella muralis]
MTEQTQNVKSAQRTLEVLELVARHPDGLTFVDLVEKLPYPKSSLHGLLQTIVAMRWLTFDPRERTYLIGVRPWEVGQSFRRYRDLTVHARRALREASRQLDETVQLGVLDDLDVVYIDKVEGARMLRLVSHVGSRLPAYVTGIGKALLSGLPESELRAHYAGRELTRYTPRTITSGDELITVIDQVRERGYATDDGEHTSGVYCVAVPVRTDGGVVAAISCSVPNARIESGEAEVPHLLETIRVCAREIARALETPGEIGRDDR